MEELQTLINNNGDIFIGELNDEVYYLKKCSFKYIYGKYFHNILLYSNSAGYIPFNSFNLDELQQFNTILSLNELLSLQQLNTMINDLGEDIQPDSKEYQQGMEIYKTYKNITDKLLNDSNIKLLIQVIENQQELLYQYFNYLPYFTKKDSEEIILGDPAGYIGYIGVINIYNSYQEMAHDHIVEELGLDLPPYIINNLDMEKVGHDLIFHTDNIFITSNGFIVQYMN